MLNSKYQIKLQSLVHKIEFIKNHAYDGLYVAPLAYAKLIVLMQNHGYTHFAIGCRHKLGLNYTKIASDKVIQKNLRSYSPRAHRFGRYLIRANQKSHQLAKRDISNVEMYTEPFKDGDGPHHNLRVITIQDVRQLAQMSILYIKYIAKYSRVIKTGHKTTLVEPNVVDFSGFKKFVILYRTKKEFLQKQLSKIN